MDSRVIDRVSQDRKSGALCRAVNKWGIEESYLNPNSFRVITLFEGLWLLSIDRAETAGRGGEPLHLLTIRKRSLKTARTRFAISQVQVAFGVYGSVISESYRFQDSRRRYRKTVVLPNRSTFGSANIDRSNLVSNYGRRAHYSRDVFKTNHVSRRRFNGITKLAGFVPIYLPDLFQPLFP